MTLDQLENTLPNGFNGATLNRLTVDYGLRRAELAVDLDTTQTRGKVHEFRPARLVLSGLSCCCVEPPSDDREPDNALCLTESGPLAQIREKFGLQVLVPPGSFGYYFYCSNRNNYIVVVAQDARLEWVPV